MWIIAKSPTQAAHLWHKTYSLVPMNILGKLACIVTSNILGIGTAESHLKQVKKVKSVQRNNTGTLKYKKQAFFLAHTGKATPEKDWFCWQVVEWRQFPRF